MDKYLALIRDWARDRGLDRADPMKQMLKLMEETGELAYRTIKDRKGRMVDGVFVKESDLN